MISYWLRRKKNVEDPILNEEGPPLASDIVMEDFDGIIVSPTASATNIPPYEWKTTTGTTHNEGWKQPPPQTASGMRRDVSDALRKIQTLEKQYNDLRLDSRLLDMASELATLMRQINKVSERMNFMESTVEEKLGGMEVRLREMEEDLYGA